MRTSLAPLYAASSNIETSIILKWLNMALKRGFDIFASVIGLIALSPIFAGIALRIKQDSPGPVFYRGPRTGKNGQLFQILKFRTMYERPESYMGARVTAKDDIRIT